LDHCPQAVTAGKLTVASGAHDLADGKVTVSRRRRRCSDEVAAGPKPASQRDISARAFTLSDVPTSSRHHAARVSRSSVPRATGWTAWLRLAAREWLGVVLLGTVALLGFAKVGEDVFAHESTSVDGAVQRWMLAHQQAAAHRLFTWITIIGGITGMEVVALLGAMFLWYHGRRRVAASVLVVPVVAISLFNVIKRIYARQRPLGLGGPVDGTYSFPSGHATASAAVCCTLAYVLWREKFLRGSAALAIAVLVPLLVGLSRLYLNVHWMTDVLGGWCAGVFVAVLGVVLYDRLRRRRRGGVVAAMVTLVACAPHVRAQADDHSSAVVITGRDMALAGGATVATAVITRADVPVARLFSDSAFHERHPGFTIFARRASVATETLYMLTGGTVYLVGRMSKDEGTADVALHTTESVIFPAMFIQVIRGALGRARPYVEDEQGDKRDADPYDFELLHGFTSFNYRSFPSMHAMASLAVATALTREMRQRETPHREVISPLLYAAASLPPLARMYLDEHWTSDIVMGAFLGVFAGQKVVGYSHEHPHNRIDNAFLGRRMDIGFMDEGRGLSLFVAPQ
jgi:undecaprenyl-diphosphatase